MQKGFSVLIVGARGEKKIRSSPAPARLRQNLLKEVASGHSHKFAFKLICDIKANPILNLFTPLPGLFLSSYCQFYPCLTFAVDKQMLLNLGLLTA